MTARLASLVLTALLAPSPRSAALLVAAQDVAPEEVALEDGTRIRCERALGAAGEPVRHGAYEAWSPEDETIVSGEFEGGVRKGRWRHRYPDGEIRIVGAYSAGRRSGTWEFRHPGGETRAKGDYDAGWPSGSWQFWTAEGELDPRHTGEYRHVRADFEGGETRYEGLTLDGRPHGRWTFYWPDGTPMLEAGYERGRPAGAWRFYHLGGCFDPGFVSQDFEDGLQLEGFFEPPALPDEDRGEPPTGLDPSRLPAALGDIPDLPPAVDRLEHARIEVSIDSYLELEDGATREAEAARLIEWGPATLPALLHRLKRADWRAPGGPTDARPLVQGVLLPIFGGRSFDWRWSDGEDAWVANRLAFLRAYGFCVLHPSRESVWRFDLRLPPSPDRDLLHSLPIEVGALTGGEVEDATLDPWRGRRDAARGLRTAGGQGTEQALASALEWLSRHQSADGSWDADGFQRNCGALGAGECDMPGNERFDVGVTGLALLALLGDGNTFAHGPYRDAVVAGARWLLGRQDPESGAVRYRPRRGAEGDPAFLYGHAIATRALCEAYASSRSPSLFFAAQLAVNEIQRARNPYGAWRYAIPANGSNDTSVTGWAVGALNAADRVGLETDSNAFAGALAWIGEATDHATGRVGYDVIGSFSSRVIGKNDHYPVEKGEAMTAAALLSRLLLGQRPEQEAILGKHADLILKTLPEWDPEGFGCDMYYWYYGSYAMYQMGGRHWTAWNEALRKAVLDSQRKDGDRAGSWDPVGPWGFEGGRVYSTALMALCLEVYYREPRLGGLEER